MIVKIENGKLEQAIGLLFNLPAKGIKSVRKTKFVKLLNERLKEVDEQRQELAKEHSNLDENGKAKTVGDKFDIKDMDAFQKDVKELFGEEMVFEGADVQKMLKTVKQILEESEKEWEGQESMTYAYLCEAFGAFEEGGDEK